MRFRVGARNDKCFTHRFAQGDDDCPPTPDIKKAEPPRGGPCQFQNLCFRSNSGLN